MAKDESEFQKLLAEAPMAPSADTVTVVGILARTADAARFVLTLPDGRTETLEVAAVKSAKAIAGAIGQTLVQLELDAKRVPESVRDQRPLNFKTPVAETHPATAELNTFIADQGHTGVYDVYTNPAVQLESANTPVAADTAQLNPNPGGYFAPFVAAAPHQADPATMAALWLFSGPRTYFNASNWTPDHHTIYKVQYDPPN